MQKTSYFILLIGLFCCAGLVEAARKELVIYHDADYSVNISSASAMKMGILTALNEVENQVQGVAIRLVSKDHRGNIRRSKHNMQQFLQDPNALFVLGGLHSPPYIKNREFINVNKVPLLVPWAAGGPVTRYPSPDNWVFRLSIDDTIAGIRISDFAVKNKQCKSPHLLLEDTPWGKSNHQTMSSYLQGKVPFNVTWFDWNTKQRAARVLLRNVIANESDCIILVANYTESKQLLHAMLSFPKEQRLPFISHWGLTGGDIPALMTADVKAGVELHFIQSCFSFSQTDNALTREAIKNAKSLFPNKFDENNLQSPAGFIHAYDLGKVVVAALNQIDLNSDIERIRADLKVALENLNEPVDGLIKTYDKPFSTWTPERDNAHEALRLEDFCMAQFGDRNQVEVKYH